MSSLDSILIDLGYTWEEMKSWPELQKRYIVAWDTQDWDEVVRLQNEEDTGATEDEVLLANRYRDRLRGS